MRGIILFNRTLLAVVLGLFFLIPISSATSVEPTPQSREIVFAIGNMPLNLDPRYATDAASERVNRLLYQSLVDFDAQSKPAPNLATWVKLALRNISLRSSKIVHHFTMISRSMRRT